MARAGVALLLVLLGGQASVPEPTRAQPPLEYREYQVRAAFLYQFARYVQWPDRGGGGPLRFCVAGGDVFEGALEETLAGETIDGRPLEVHIILGPESGCHVLYIPDRTTWPVYLRAVTQDPVLTVGEPAGFFDQGGIIRLFLDGRNIRFELNLDAAQRAGVRLSARLVPLARHVRHPSGAP